MSAVQTITIPTQPDIQYHPEYEKFKERTRHRKETETLQSTLPENFPEKLVSPLVRDDWVYQLSDDQLDELDAALKSFKGG